MRTGRLLVLSAATALCSPMVSLVVLRYIFLKNGALNTALAQYPSLITGLIATLGLLSGLIWLLFSNYRQRSHWPRTCGLAAQSDVPTYLHGGDLFLLQIPFCAAQLATVMAVAQVEMTAPRAVVASYGAGVAFVAICALYPAPRCCRPGGGSWAKDAARHGRHGFLISLALCIAAVFAFLFTSYSTTQSFGISFSSQSYYGLALLAGAQGCVVGRNAMARCLIRRNARRLHAPDTPVSAALSSLRKTDQDTVPRKDARPADNTGPAEGGNASSGTASAEQDETRGPEFDMGEQDDDEHLFRGLDEDDLTKLDAVFTTPLYLHHPIAVGTVGTFEMAQLGGHVTLAPVALLVFYGTNTSAAMLAWLQQDVGFVPMLGIGWLALASVLQAPLYSALALAGPPAAVAYVDVVATATAALLGASVLTDASAPNPELGPPQLAALCIFAAAAAVALMTRTNAAETAASQQQLLYLADALPNLSAVQMEDLMRVDVSAGHEVFQRLVAEAGYGGTVPQTTTPRWTSDVVSINPVLSRARELEAERELLRFKFPGLDDPPSPTAASQPEQHSDDSGERIVDADAAAVAVDAEPSTVQRSAEETNFEPLVPTPPKSPGRRADSHAEPEAMVVENLDGEP